RRGGPGPVDERVEQLAGAGVAHCRKKVTGAWDVDPEEGRDDLRTRPRVAVTHHLEDQRASKCLAPRLLVPRQGMAPDAIAAGHRLQLFQVEPHELDAGPRLARGDEAGGPAARGPPPR